MKLELKKWTLEAIEKQGGSVTIVEICKHIWKHHEKELRAAGDLFYTWQYDMRWAGQKLEDEGLIVRQRHGRSNVWRKV